MLSSKILLLLLLVTSSARANYLSLHFYPAPTAVNWSSPSSLARSTVFNSIVAISHSIGHATVEVSCDNGEHFLSGATSADDKEQNTLLFKDKIGLGILFHDFHGRLQSDREITSELTERYKTGHLGVVTYLISTSTCQRLSNYYHEYVKLGYGQHYGLSNRPRYREGAGCTAFAKSFLDIAGLNGGFEESAWARTINVPLIYIGRPWTENSVSLSSLVFPKSRTHWSSDADPHMTVMFWDPDRMYKWVRSTWSYLKKHPQPGSTTALREEAREIILDRVNTPTPTETFWLD